MKTNTEKQTIFLKPAAFAELAETIFPDNLQNELRESIHLEHVTFIKSAE